jgi:hypothetical protein
MLGRVLARQPVDISENSFLGALLIVASAIGSIVGVAALVVENPATLVGIAAGSAWALSFCLFVIVGIHKRRIAQLENDLDDLKIELADTRRQSDHWSVAAKNVAEATTTVLQMMPTTPIPPPRRQPSAIQAGSDHDSGANQ